jgi:hypothetical protein
MCSLRPCLTHAIQVLYSVRGVYREPPSGLIDFIDLPRCVTRDLLKVNLFSLPATLRAFYCFKSKLRSRISAYNKSAHSPSSKSDASSETDPRPRSAMYRYPELTALVSLCLAMLLANALRLLEALRPKRTAVIHQLSPDIVSSPSDSASRSGSNNLSVSTFRSFGLWLSIRDVGGRSPYGPHPGYGCSFLSVDLSDCNHRGRKVRRHVSRPLRTASVRLIH